MGQLPKTNTEIEIEKQRLAFANTTCGANFFGINGDLKILTDPKRKEKSAQIRLVGPL